MTFGLRFMAPRRLHVARVGARQRLSVADSYLEQGGDD